MVRTQDQVTAIIRALIRAVESDFQVSAAILFGSYAHGRAHADSDIDVAIVSPDFRERPEMEVLECLSRTAMHVDTALEVLAFTPEELVAPDPRSFAYHVQRDGVTVSA